jgi:HK97 family phage major capsid protein
MQYALRSLSGDTISRQDESYRAVADVITSDNLGVVPDAFLQGELIGVIDASRPFMTSTRRLPTPRGMTLHVPKIDQRPLVGLQSEEKTELASRAIKVTTADFTAKTKGGVIDISLQLLKQSEPAFLDLALRLMFEAYAQETETEALQELTGDIAFNDAGAIDPSTPALGAAYLAAFDETRAAPDTIWLSPAAIGAFIDATATGSGLPRYPNVVAGNGASGSISGLRVVPVPAMADVGVDVIIGPSNAFAWAESGAYTLQVDVPSRAGRDVAVVGIVWFAPYYPAAFTGYTIS